MTTVLIIDNNASARFALEAQLKEVNQFERVLSCSNFDEAQALVRQYPVKVVLVEADQASDAGALQQFQLENPELGLVLLQGKSGLIEPSVLAALGAHAQASRFASPMEFVSCIAKAMVARLKPGKAILGKLFSDGK